MFVPPKTIIVVEDEPDTAEMFAEMARLAGYQVFKSLSGLRAIDLISEKRPAAILLDVMMPDLSGLGVLQLLQRDPRLSKIPVILISAKTMPADIQEGLDAGAAYYLTKPVAFADLKRVLNTVLTSSVDTTTA